MITEKENTMNIPFNFTYYAMKLLGKNLYSNPWTAISEIVANGIDSKASEVHVLVDMRDKQHAKVEIFDNGGGMSTDDLRTKYTLIGRNKRETADNVEGKTLGRKGIGKLAALYLSPVYYLYTKTNSVSSAWCVNTFGIDDNDTPMMQEIENNNDILISRDFWSKQETGTMIHLSDVDLRKIGPERLKRLPLNLADYYLDNIINCQILVCVLTQESDKIDFIPIKKQTHFDTMYAIFDNTGLNYKNRLQEKLYITPITSREEVNYPRSTKILDNSKYETSGVIPMTNLNGQICELPYELKGWIGIHASLDLGILRRNSPEFVKRPNALRLYVRGKLAVSDLMPYLSMSQALISYIEGDISFDVLDDDNFEDASTSSREGYSISDPRIKKLIEILRKIVRALINERTEIGNIITNELNEIKEKEAEENRKKVDAANQLAKEAEEERIAAELEKEKAQKEKKDAEVQAFKESAARKEVEEERDQIKEESAHDKKRLFVLENNFISSGEQYKHGVHLALNYAKEIRSSIIEILNNPEHYIKQEISQLMDIDKSAEKITRLPNFIESVNFHMRSPDLETDLIDFIKQYIENNGSSRLEYHFEIDTDICIKIDFPEIIMLVDNIISNAIKAHANKLTITAKKNNSDIIIDFSDNGTGLQPRYLKDPNKIFNLGETTTIGGFGIGCYQMMRIVQKLDGKVYALQNKDRGMTIRIVI